VTSSTLYRNVFFFFFSVKVMRDDISFLIFVIRCYIYGRIMEYNIVKLNNTLTNRLSIHVEGGVSPKSNIDYLSFIVILHRQLYIGGHTYE